MEELTGGQSSKGCSQWGYIWLVIGHHGAPLGSALEFNILIFLQYFYNGAGAECTISNSADDTKLTGAVDSAEG